MSRHVLVAGWPQDSYLWRNVPLRDGRVPMAGDKYVAVLGDNVAEVLGKKLGDTVELHGEKFRVIGITKYTSVINRGSIQPSWSSSMRPEPRPRWRGSTAEPDAVAGSSAAFHGGTGRR